MEAAESNLVPGYRLDRYELLCPIASGGMASVWLARLRGKRGFEKLFAIKTIKTELISDSHFQEMFLDEARIASGIVHPNVAQILDLGEQDDTLYIAMEYVDGDSVAKVSRLALKRGVPLPAGVALRIVADTCAGLHAAHQLKDASGVLLGVVHRDVSPQNILLASGGSAKVIDFGLVKARNRSAGETGHGVVKGKIRYMAPEQVSGGEIDHRADIWAAGMCLLELVTGHVPYQALDDLDVVKRLMSAEPAPPLDVRPPPAIERILARALSRDPKARFESCAAMKKAIEAAIQELGVPAEHDDVAEFIKNTLPDLATKRAKTIEKAMHAADSRQLHADSLESLGPNDMAFAATEVSARNPHVEHDEELPLTRRHGRGALPQGVQEEPSSTSSYGASRSASTTSLREQLGERKRRGGLFVWLTAAIVMGGGGLLLWPKLKEAAMATTASSSVPAVSAAPSASASASAEPSATPPPSASTLDLDTTPDEDAGTTHAPPPPTHRSHAHTPAPTTTRDAAPDAPKYNPAWSILTNPPEAGIPPPPPSPTTTSEEPK